jgi:hypothetical protein
VPDERPGQRPEPEYRQRVFGRPPRAERLRRDFARDRHSLVPTWVYAVTLAVVVAAWAIWIILG